MLRKGGCAHRRSPLVLPGADKAQEGRREGFCRKMASEENHSAENPGRQEEQEWREIWIRNYRLSSEW